MARIRTVYDITPPHSVLTSATPQWSNIVNWSNLSQVHSGAAAASAYTFRTYPPWQSPVYRAIVEPMLSVQTNGVPVACRVAAIVYDSAGASVIDSSWGSEYQITEGVRGGQIDITTKFNQMINGQLLGSMWVFFMEVKGSGILYISRLNLFTDI